MRARALQMPAAAADETLSGAVSPSATPGSVQIVITKRVGKKYKKYATKTVTLSGGAYTYKWKTKVAAKYHVVATYTGATVDVTTYLTSTSKTKTVNVK